MFDSLRKKLIFFAGDVHREKAIGGFAWGSRDKERQISFEEACEALDAAEVGYVGLHRNIGDLSNVAIRGFMKHAWLHTGKNVITEAVSEGVLKRHALYALMSDFVTIGKPDVSPADMQVAANRIDRLAEIRCQYDDHFCFDLEVEESMFADKDIAIANMKKYDLGVSCTEAVALGYVGHRRKLGLYRVKLGSREVIIPDNYLTAQFPVFWASKYATPENARKLGLHEEGCDMLADYWCKEQ